MDKTEVLEKLTPIMGLTTREATKPSVVMGDGKLFVRPAPHSQLIEVGATGNTALLRQTNVPQGLVKKLQPKTLGNVLNEVLGECSLLIKDRLIVDVANSRQWSELPIPRVLDTIDKAIPKAEFHRVMVMPHHTVRLETLGIDQKAVKRNDILRAGAVVQFSPVGIIKPIVQNFCIRLACTNGVTATDVLQEFDFTGDGDGSFWQWLRSSVKEAYKAVSPIAARYQLMSKENIPADHRASILTNLLRSAGIHGDDAETVRAEALANPPRNSYDMVNLITWATSHVVTNPITIAKGQMAAGYFATETEHRRQCPACHRMLN